MVVGLGEKVPILGYWCLNEFYPFARLCSCRWKIVQYLVSIADSLAALSSSGISSLNQDARE